MPKILIEESALDRIKLMALELQEQRDELLEALKHAENALADYVPTIEKTGAALNYGHHVIKMAKAAIAKATGEQA